jgi:NADH-ubiquinone oxidoreductase chain 4
MCGIFIKKVHKEKNLIFLLRFFYLILNVMIRSLAVFNVQTNAFDNYNSIRYTYVYPEYDNRPIIASMVCLYIFPLVCSIYLMFMQGEKNNKIVEDYKKRSNYMKKEFYKNSYKIFNYMHEVTDNNINVYNKTEEYIKNKKLKYNNIDLTKKLKDSIKDKNNNIYLIFNNMFKGITMRNVYKKRNNILWIIIGLYNIDYSRISILYSDVEYTEVIAEMYNYVVDTLKEIINIINNIFNYIKLDENLLVADMLSWVFIWLNALIFPFSFLSNWTNVINGKIYFIILMISLETMLTWVFTVTDYILFYVSFETTLPLLFFLIGLYGSTQKIRAAFYIFLYTLFGSLFMLLSFVKINAESGTTSFITSTYNNFNKILQIWLWIPLFLSFSVKTPLVPVHTWLPLAHSEANVSGSIVLAAIVLKLALYGFIRILIGIFNYATKLLFPFVMGLSSLSIIYSSLSTIRQFDFKVLVAYSSIAHMGSSTLGAFSDTSYGIIGSILFGLAHGFVSPALFIIVGLILYDRCGSRIINYYKGLTIITPLLSLLFLIFLFGNMGVPLTANFLGEFLSLLAAYQVAIYVVAVATLSVVFSAIYSIFLFNRINSGTLSTYIITIPDLFRREYYILLALAFFTLLLGIYPSIFTSYLEYGIHFSLFFFSSPIIFDKHNKGKYFEYKQLRKLSSFPFFVLDSKELNESIEYISNLLNDYSYYFIIILLMIYSYTLYSKKYLINDSPFLLKSMWVLIAFALSFAALHYLLVFPMWFVNLIRKLLLTSAVFLNLCISIKTNGLLSFKSFIAFSLLLISMFFTIFSILVLFNIGNILLYTIIISIAQFLATFFSIWYHYIDIGGDLISKIDGFKTFMTNDNNIVDKEPDVKQEQAIESKKIKKKKSIFSFFEKKRPDVDVPVLVKPIEPIEPPKSILKPGPEPFQLPKESPYIYQDRRDEWLVRFCNYFRIPVPVPDPEPLPVPDPDPVVPNPIPDPVPVPAPDPEPDPIPVPDPNTSPDPALNIESDSSTEIPLRKLTPVPSLENNPIANRPKKQVTFGIATSKPLPKLTKKGSWISLIFSDFEINEFVDVIIIWVIEFLNNNSIYILGFSILLSIYIVYTKFNEIKANYILSIIGIILIGSGFILFLFSLFFDIVSNPLLWIKYSLTLFISISNVYIAWKFHSLKSIQFFIAMFMLFISLLFITFSLIYIFLSLSIITYIANIIADYIRNIGGILLQYPHPPIINDNIPNKGCADPSKLRSNVESPEAIRDRINNANNVVDPNPYGFRAKDYLERNNIDRSTEIITDSTAWPFFRHFKFLDRGMLATFINTESGHNTGQIMKANYHLSRIHFFQLRNIELRTSLIDTNQKEELLFTISHNNREIQVSINVIDRVERGLE